MAYQRHQVGGVLCLSFLAYQFHFNFDSWISFCGFADFSASRNCAGLSDCSAPGANHNKLHSREINVFIVLIIVGLFIRMEHLGDCTGGICGRVLRILDKD